MRVPIMLVSAMCACFYINTRMALIFLLVAPVLLIALFFVFRYAYPIFRRMFKKIDQMNNVLQENVRGIRVVKSFVREDYETLISEGGKYYQLYTGAFELEKWYKGLSRV